MHSVPELGPQLLKVNSIAFALNLLLKTHREAWWAAIYGIAQSQTRLKRLSSSSSICPEVGLLDHMATLVLVF